MDRRQFLKLTGALGVAAALGMPIARKAEAATDALTNVGLSDLKSFTDWLARYNKKGYVGEVGIALNRGNFTDQSQWGALLDAWMSAADAAALWVTGQVVSEHYALYPNGQYFASMHGTAGNSSSYIVLDHPTAAGLVLEPHTYGGKGTRGYNFADAQLRAGKFVAGFSNDNPGVYGSDYWYPTVNNNPRNASGKNSFDYLAARPNNGCTKVHRVGFRWERIQPVLGGNLDAVELSRLKQCVANAKAAGLRVILDVHNYGGYYFADGRQPLNSARLTVSYLMNLWARLVSNFKSETAVFGYDLMNEPFNDGGIRADAGNTEEKTWERITQAIVDQTRRQGSNQWIFAPSYAGMDGFVAAHPRPWITDSLNRTAYTTHQYFDMARYGYMPDGNQGRPTITDPDTGQTYKVEYGTGGGQYVHSYNSDNVLAKYRVSAGIA